MQILPQRITSYDALINLSTEKEKKKGKAMSEPRSVKYLIAAYHGEEKCRVDCIESGH